MAESITIDKQSKLFQKFIQSKTQKDHLRTAAPMNQPFQPAEYSHTKENNINASNFKQLQKANYGFKTQQEKQAPKIQPMKNFDNRNGGHHCSHKDQRWVNNSLNIEGGLGLDKILKRAIQKVRASKIQELYKNNNGRDMKQEDSLQKLTQSKRREIFLENDPKQSSTSKKMLKEANKPQFLSRKDSQHIFQVKQQALNQDQQPLLQQSLIAKLKQQVSDLKQQLQEEKDKSESLKQQIAKLKKQINIQVDLHQQTENEKQQLRKQISQLQKITAEKERQLKKYSDDANYWRNQHELLHLNHNTMKSSISLLQKKIQALTNEKEGWKKEKAERQDQSLQLRIEMAKITEESKLAKQYLYELTIKLYSYQKEINSLKGGCSDVVDKGAGFSVEQQPRQETTQPIGIHPARKRQFSRQRSVSTLKAQFTKTDQVTKKTFEPSLQSQISIAPGSHLSSNTSQTDISRQAKVAAIKAQLQQLNESKIMNGKIRRRRIELQRELQQFIK